MPAWWIWLVVFGLGLGLGAWLWSQISGRTEEFYTMMSLILTITLCLIMMSFMVEFIRSFAE